MRRLIDGVSYRIKSLKTPMPLPHWKSKSIGDGRSVPALAAAHVEDLLVLDVEQLAQCDVHNFSQAQPAPRLDPGRAAAAGGAPTLLATLELDSFVAGAALVGAGLRPAVLNMANEFNCGGAWCEHVGSQEEALFRTSSLPLSLWPLRRRNDRRFGAFDGRIPRAARPAYPWASDATVIYSPTVVVTRDSQGRPLPGKLRTTLSVVSVAAQDLRTGHQHVPDDACFDRALTREKCRSVLWAAAHNGHDAVVLGALGCGAFRNDPDEVCAVFRELLQPGGEFGATFSAVIFAVIKSGRNLRAFAQGGFPLLKVMSRRPDEVGAQISSLMEQAGGGGGAASGGGAAGKGGGGAAKRAREPPPVVDLSGDSPPQQGGGGGGGGGGGEGGWGRPKPS